MFPVRRGGRTFLLTLFLWSLVGKSTLVEDIFQKHISMENCGSRKELDSKSTIFLKKKKWNFIKIAGFGAIIFYSARIPIQKRKWIKHWVLGCNFSDKILHFRYGLQSPAAKGSFKKEPRALPSFPEALLNLLMWKSFSFEVPTL